MRSFPGAALLAALAWSCAPAEPEAGLWIELVSAAREVELGGEFVLEVVRSYGRDLVAEPFDEGCLAPLEVELLESARRTRRGRVTETLRYRARAFELERVRVGPPTLRVRPRSGGAERSVEGQALELTVRSALAAAWDGAAPLPGPPELPGGMLREVSPRPWRLLAGAGLLLLIGVLFLVRSKRAPRRAAAGSRRPAPPAPDARARALARLAALRASLAGTSSDDEAFHVELSAALRHYLEGALALPAPRRSSEELLADPRAARLLDGAQRAGLGRLLLACDAVKFARRAASPAERAERLLAAEAWLRADSPRPEPPAEDTP